MKPCILFIALLIPLVVFASKFSYSDIPQKEGKPYYQFTVPAPGVEKMSCFTVLSFSWQNISGKVPRK